MEVTAKVDVTPEEGQFQELWRSYFITLAIPERRNLKLQQGKVPLKVRGSLTEFGGEQSIFRLSIGNRLRYAGDEYPGDGALLERDNLG